MFLPRAFRRFGPLWLGLMAYRYWRRLSPERKAALKERMRGLIARMLGAPASQRSGVVLSSAGFVLLDDDGCVQRQEFSPRDDLHAGDPQATWPSCPPASTRS
jgi:hypothetical protein